MTRIMAACLLLAGCAQVGPEPLPQGAAEPLPAVAPAPQATVSQVPVPEAAPQAQAVAPPAEPVPAAVAERAAPPSPRAAPDAAAPSMTLTAPGYRIVSMEPPPLATLGWPEASDPTGDAGPAAVPRRSATSLSLPSAATDALVLPPGPLVSALGFELASPDPTAAAIEGRWLCSPSGAGATSACAMVQVVRQEAP